VLASGLRYKLWRVPESSRARRNSRGRVIFWVLFGLCALVVVGGAVTGITTARSFSVPSTSMANTIRPGDRVVVDRGAQVYRGDLIVEQESSVAPGYYIRRVIGLPGDRVACCNARGQITVNGRPLAETYLYPGDPASRIRFHVTVPRGEMWLLGDHRSLSFDSQSKGPLAVRVVGRIFLILRAGHVILPQTPRTFVVDSLAPGGSQIPPALIGAEAGSFAFFLLVVLSIFGIVRYVIRRRHRTRAREPEVPQAVP
jgi:signal peptidase I